MKSFPDRLLQAAAYSRPVLGEGSREKISRFILSRQNSDGGFRGRSMQSDLYYTLFSVATLKAIDYPVPVFKVWKYVLSFGLGKQLDLVHWVCLFRLRTAFSMLGITRRRFLKQFEKHRNQPTYELFMKLLVDEESNQDIPVQVALDAPTPQLAAAMLVNRPDDSALEKVLLGRGVDSGGFASTDKGDTPDLLSTASALFALVERGTNLGSIQRPCLKYVESLWRDSGGFAGYIDDASEDAASTFYALLSIGCLVRSMAKK